MKNIDIESLEIVDVNPQEDYTLELKFSNGEQRKFDASPYLDRGIFKELKNIFYFKKVSLNYGTVTWPHEQDFSPVTLYLEGKPF
jgi:hypothetical protein